MLNYIKYYLVALLSLWLIPSFFLGGYWLWSGFIIPSLVAVLGDALLGDEPSEEEVRYPKLLELPLYWALPILSLVLLSLAWISGSGTTDFLGMGAALNLVLPFDVFEARANNTFFTYLGAVFSAGFMLATYGTNVAHELTHRTHSPWAMIQGRWLFSMSCNADFAIEHVYGHHVNVGTQKDPATARRGENVYAFILRSTLMGHVSAWHLELKRLKNRGYSPWSWRNQMLTGYAMSLCWIALFAWAGGVPGLVLFFGVAIIAKSLLEIVNFMEHYGLSREEGEPVMPHHSWNSNKRMSGILLFSLTRHSAHHENGSVPFWELSAYEHQAPTLPLGYLSTVFVCLVPFLWRRHIEAELRAWEHPDGNELLENGGIADA